MSEAKFTKGPWVARGRDKSRVYGMVRDDKEGLIAATGGNEANGRLIAKAPEMYEILNTINDLLTKCVDFDGENLEWIERHTGSIEELLKQVRGE